MKRGLAGLMVLLGASLIFAQEESRAVFREISGTVEVRAPGSAEWIPARQGESIAQAAVVSTGFKSTAVIAVGNSVLSVRPLTRLTVEEMQAARDERVNVSLQTGRIRVDVKPPIGGKTEFTVRSPSATASVRGTAFEFDGVRLRVDEGRVHVTGGDRSGVYVGVGHSVSADIETGRTISPAEVAREELVPSLPAGVNSVPETPVMQPSTGTIDATFHW
jgi:ferric-dicitrate binding protein FerR (iron transport regulator)